MPKLICMGLKFQFQIPKHLVLELTWKHFSCSEHISWEAIGIWPLMHFSWQRLMHRLWSTIIFISSAHSTLHTAPNTLHLHLHLILYLHMYTS